LPGNGQGAAAADPPLDAHGFGRGLGWWAGGARVADTGLLGGGQRVGQAAQQDTVVDELQQAVVEAHGETSPCVLVSDRVLPTGQADGADRVDRAVGLDRAPD